MPLRGLPDRGEKRWPNCTGKPPPMKRSATCACRNRAKRSGKFSARNCRKISGSASWTTCRLQSHAGPARFAHGGRAGRETTGNGGGRYFRLFQSGHGMRHVPQVNVKTCPSGRLKRKTAKQKRPRRAFF